MKRCSWLVASIFAALVTVNVGGAQMTSPRNGEVELFLRNAWCENTTEEGADEVYILLLARSSDGRRISTRLPADAPHTAAGHWDMNDDKGLGCDRASGDSHCIENKALGTFDTRGNTSWDVVVAFMEEDRGLEKTPEQIVSEGIERGGGDLIGTLLGILISVATSDSDDYLGSVVAHISAGRVDWRKGDRLRDYTPYPNDPNRLLGFQMIGDGANYRAHIGLR